MTSIPPNLARVPNLLSSQIVRDNITRTSVSLLDLNGQLTSGKRLNSASDDPVGASLIGTLAARISASDTRLRNIDHASSSLGTVDNLLGEVTDLARQAKTIASDQIGVGSDAGTRKAQASVVESLIQELFALSNTTFADLHVLGGERTGVPPIERFFDGFRYVGRGDGLLTDLGPALRAPITIGADQALGALSARVEGDVDLNPSITASTRLDSLRGGRGAGITLGQVNVQIDSGTPPVASLAVDLSGSATVGDVLDKLESAIRAADPAALSGGFPGGAAVNAAGSGIAFNVAAGYQITISEVGGGTTAQDLGLTGAPYAGAGATHAADLDPRLTVFTAFGDLNPASPFAPGDIVLDNGGRQGTVTVTNTTTIADFQRDVEKLGIGVRAEISSDGRHLNLINEVSGATLAVRESGGGTLTATSLGLRSLAGTTRTADFNFGRGVQIADGQIDPTTGLPDAARNTDFRITLTDGTAFTVDLVPSDLVDVNAVLARINAAAAGAGVAVGSGPGQFQATLLDGANGIALEDNLGGAGAVSVATLNGRAAEDLGLLSGVFTAAGGGNPARLAGEDRAKVRVDSLFSTLIDLKRALETNDVTGITFAGDRLEADLDRVTSTRAVVGGRASRVEAGRRREEDSQLLDKKVKSGLEDLDFVDATTRFSLLQLVQQAGYAASAQTQGRSLLDFLR